MSDVLELRTNVITGECWKVCPTCDASIPTDGECHGTEGFLSAEKQRERRLKHWKEWHRRREQAVLDAITGA